MNLSSVQKNICFTNYINISLNPNRPQPCKKNSIVHPSKHALWKQSLSFLRVLLRSGPVSASGGGGADLCSSVSLRPRRPLHRPTETHSAAPHERLLLLPGTFTPNTSAHTLCVVRDLLSVKLGGGTDCLFFEI